MARDSTHYPAARLRAARRAIVARLYLQGLPYKRIAERVRDEEGMGRTSVSTIHADVMALLAEWRAERLACMDDYVTLELRRIDGAVEALWEEWEKSRQGGARPGAVPYIAEIRQQLAERRRLLGMYAPERREVAGPGGEAIRVRAMGDEELAGEIARLAGGLPDAPGGGGDG